MVNGGRGMIQAREGSEIRNKCFGGSKYAKEGILEGDFLLFCKLIYYSILINQMLFRQSNL